jgi:phenylacetate-CoA ligase
MIDFFDILKLSGFPVREARKIFESIKQEPDLLAWQLERRDEIVRYHYQNNPFYRAKVTSDPGDWDNLPIITKSDLQGDFLSKVPQVKQPYYFSQTSGSSGHPLTIVKDRMTHTLAWLMIEHHYSKCGINLNDLQARFYGIPLSGLGYYKEKLKDLVSNRVRFPVFNLNDEILEQWLTKFRKRKFKYVYGYTNSIAIFADFLNRKGIVLKSVCPTLKACIVTAEMCTEDDENLIKSSIGVPVFNEYGASEISIIGFKGEGMWEVSDEIVYLEVVDDQGRVLPPGTRGRILCTLLQNRGTPLIRYEIGDLGSIIRENGKTWVTDLMGRSSDTVVLPSGRKVPGLTFYYVARQLLSDCDNLREFRIVQTGLLDFEVEVVFEDEEPASLTAIIRKGFDEYLEPGLNVTIKPMDIIVRTSAGKFKHFVALK